MSSLMTRLVSPLAPIADRFQMPDTDYFRSLGPQPLAKLAGYARALRRASLVGSNLENALVIPLAGAFEYSPFGAGNVEWMRLFPEMADILTDRFNKALVASPSTAMLGLGEAAEGTEGSLRATMNAPVIYGKAKYFMWTAGVTAIPQPIDTFLSKDQMAALRAMPAKRVKNQLRIWRAEIFAQHVRALASTYGFINIEDAQGADLPIIFSALDCLRGETAVWSDDMQGTGVITAAAVLAWTELTQRRMQNIRVVILGAGAGGMGIYNELLNHGVPEENILVADSGSKGIQKLRKGQPFAIHEGRTDVEQNPFKRKMRKGIPSGMTVERFVEGGVDVVINVGSPETFSADPRWTEWLCRKLTQSPLVLPMTNPEPVITPARLKSVRPDAFFGSGNQTYPNPVNNFTAFGFVGLGALTAMAGGVTPAMTKAAALGILRVAKMGPPRELIRVLPPDQQEFGPSRLVPGPEDDRLIIEEAGAVAKVAAREGLSRRLTKHPTGLELAQYDEEIDRRLRMRREFVREMRRRVGRDGVRRLRREYPRHFAPFFVRRKTLPAYHVAPQIDRDTFESFARALGVREEHWQGLVEGKRLKPRALTMVLEKLRPATEGDTDQARMALRELEIIVQIASVSPPLGLALALRRTRVGVSHPENRTARPTVFHRGDILRVVFREIPEARGDIYAAFTGIPQLAETTAAAD